MRVCRWRGDKFAAWRAAIYHPCCVSSFCDFTTSWVISQMRNPFKSPQSGVSLNPIMCTVHMNNAQRHLYRKEYCIFFTLFVRHQPIAGGLIPPLCPAALCVSSDSSSTEVHGGNNLSSFWSRRSSHPQKVMSCEMNGFYSSVILRSWHETLYPTPFPLRSTPPNPFSFFFI